MVPLGAILVCLAHFGGGLSMHPKSNFDLQAILSNPPKLHELRGELTSDLRIDDFTCSELSARLKPGLKTLETGAGLSTIIFAANGCDHTCIAAHPNQLGRVKEYCRSKGIETSAVNFIVAQSSDAIHRLPSSHFDLILIDGCHGFPSIFVDFYYAAKLLKLGGTLVIDDLHIYTCQLVARFMQADPGWKMEIMTSRVALAIKIADTADEEWINQRFIVQRSSRPSLMKSALSGRSLRSVRSVRPVRFFLDLSKPLRARLGLTGNQILGKY
jgi:hypothetical protein